MANINYCYPDWENFTGNSNLNLRKKKKNTYKNYNNSLNTFKDHEGFYPIEGFSNKNVNRSASVEVDNVPMREPSNQLNITYGAPNEYLPAFYNTLPSADEELVKQVNYTVNSKRNNRTANNRTANNRALLGNTTESKSSVTDELKEEMRLIREMLQNVVDRLDNKSISSEEKEPTTVHDMVLFVIFGLFVIFVLEGTSKIVVNMSKRGRFK